MIYPQKCLRGHLYDLVFPKFFTNPDFEKFIIDKIDRFSGDFVVKIFGFIGKIHNFAGVFRENNFSGMELWILLQ